MSLNITRAHILVAIETDATRYHGEHASRPRLLERSESEQVLAHLAADLANLFPEITRCSLTMPGALFDQTQLLQPGYPVYGALESLLKQATGDRPPQPCLLSLSADAGRMPSTELQPEPDIPLGLLQTLPLVVSGDPGLVTQLSGLMEYHFLEQGQLSAHSAKGIEANFEITLSHARFMTLTDLHAMLRLQLEHFGFLPLWELLDAALSGRAEKLAALGRCGQRFTLRDGSVYCRFETFDYWANRGSGRDHSGLSQILAKAYTDWTREYRQYLTTLKAHAVPVIQYLPQRKDDPLEASFLIEESPLNPGRDVAQLTEHNSGDLGTIAVTVAHDTRQLNYYPLSPAGLNDLHASIRASGHSSSGVSFPGCINYDEDARRLIPDALPSGHV